MNPRHANENKNAPVKEGGIYTGSIESVGGKGDGILRIQGFVVFVPGVNKGDYVKVKVTKVLPKVSFGELIEKVEPPSPAVLKKKARKEEEDDGLSEFMTTDGDSEDFGEDDDDEEL
ncbi:MAG: TRAM domain-containing protein [Candidatus Woesearchaeota archaeon]